MRVCFTSSSSSSSSFSSSRVCREDDAFRGLRTRRGCHHRSRGGEGGRRGRTTTVKGLRTNGANERGDDEEIRGGSREQRNTKPWRKKNAPTIRVEPTREEKAAFAALNERILECASAEEIGAFLEAEDIVALSDVNISTIFSLLGRKCNAKKM